MMNEIDGRVSLDPLAGSPGLSPDASFNSNMHPNGENRDIGLYSSLYAAAFSNPDCDEDDYRSSLSSHLDTSSFTSSLVSSPCPVRGKKTSINRYSCIFASSGSTRSSICLGPRTPAANPEEYFWPASLSPSAIRDSSSSAPRSTISSISRIASLQIPSDGQNGGDEDNGPNDDENREKNILDSKNKLEASAITDSVLRKNSYPALSDSIIRHYKFHSSSQENTTDDDEGENNAGNADNASMYSLDLLFSL